MKCLCARILPECFTEGGGSIITRPWLPGETEARESQVTHLARSSLAAEPGFELELPGYPSLSVMLGGNDDDVHVHTHTVRILLWYWSRFWRVSAELPGKQSPCSMGLTF